MKIERVHTIRLAHAWKTTIYVVVTTDDGAIGIGEATLGQLSRAVVGAIREIEQMAVGLDPHDTGLLRQRVTRDIYADGGQIKAAALAGIEMAFWDVIGRAAGVPLFKLLGGRVQPRLRVYANGWYRGERDPDSMAQSARQVVERGYTALKIDPFGANWRTISRSEIDLSIQILRSVREAVGDEADLIVEAHSRFDVATACHIARQIEPLAPLWFEEPIPYSDLSGYGEVVSKSGVPIATGESLWRVDQFVQLLSAAKIPIVQFDPIHVGGVAPSRAIVELTEVHNALVAPHSASGIINHLVCAHISTSAPNALLLESFQDFEEEPPTSLVRSSLTVANGYAELGEAPGIGAEFSLAELLSHHTDSLRKDQNLFEPGWELRKSR